MGQLFPKWSKKPNILHNMSTLTTTESADDLEMTNSFLRHPAFFCVLLTPEIWQNVSLDGSEYEILSDTIVLATI